MQRLSLVLPAELGSKLPSGISGSMQASLLVFFWHAVSPLFLSRVLLKRNVNFSPGAGIMEADDRQVTTVFVVQLSFHHRHSTNRVS